MRPMKDSGIEWIGRIPENWATPPLRSKYSFGKGLAITKADLADDGAPVINYGQIHSKDNIGVAVRDTLIRHLPLDHSSLSESSKTKSGDLIFADTSEDVQGCGNCVYIDKKEPIYAGYHTLILRPKGRGLGRYYAYLFATDAWRSQVRANVAGVKVYSITQDILKKTTLLEPSVEEQERIVAFLDTKCSEIDSLIAAKEKTNALLKERRQSLIYEAVTKGLDPTVPMKDSGIEWIGLIPNNWRMVKLGFLFKNIGSGTTPTSADSSYYDGLYNWLQTGDLNDKHISDTAKKITDSAVDRFSALQQYPEGTLVMAMYGATIGKLGILDIPCYTNQACCAFNKPNNAVTEYVYYWLLANRENIITLSVGGGQPNISQGIIREIKVSIPDTLAEQEKIVNHLRMQCSRIDALLEQNDTTIRKLKEYRQSLIYEAVTGKIMIDNEVKKNED